MLSVEDLVEIHEILVDWFDASEDPISPSGIKDRNLLESAAARPYQTVDGRDAYRSIFDRAAALFHSLVNNHAFHNGNKRIALVAAQALLAQESQWLDHSSDEEMFEFTRKAAAHELTANRADETAYIAEWLEANSRKAIKGEHPLKYGELKQILQRFGYSIDSPEGELLWIYKDGERVERIIKQGIKGFRPYHTDYVSGLRKRLDLTTEHGIDSAVFYGHKGVGNNAALFIELRIEVMRQLAKT
ncbi:MAG: type II toxin-antitoxin system death-on-curing family toxin [Mesorhizobium sp.]|nr:type II toxin-antitoxin system death-on-curing family toxin [Mesorhizobium sp. M8A.F.Ca.ET.023.01.1.1]RWC69774.1 MAG: type II toxin-antitoxin system death-on-curing family toxin [Mesorhizobium sp.]